MQTTHLKTKYMKLCDCNNIDIIFKSLTKIRRKWSTGQQWLLQVCNKRPLILYFAEKKENAPYSQLSSEIQSGGKLYLYYLIYFSHLRSSLFSISLSPSIVNSSCKLSKSTILLKKIFKFNFQVSLFFMLVQSQ